MAFTARELISKAYYLSQVVARDAETVSGSQIIDGLYLLNALLDVKGGDLRLIPYWTPYSFPSVVGQEVYFIPNLLSIEQLTFNLGPVQFPMGKISRADYFGGGKIDNIQALPFNWHPERTLGGMNIYLYFTTAGIYTMKLIGKFGLTEVGLDDDLLLVYDKYYIEYLRFALAEYIAIDYTLEFPPQSLRKLNEIRKKLMDTSATDFTMRKVSTLQTGSSLTWAQINFGKGFTRPS